MYSAQRATALVKRCHGALAASCHAVMTGLPFPQKECSYQRALAYELGLRGFMTSLEHPCPVYYAASNGTKVSLAHERIDILATHVEGWAVVVEVKRGGTKSHAAVEQALRYGQNLNAAGGNVLCAFVASFGKHNTCIETAYASTEADRFAATQMRPSRHR